MKYTSEQMQIVIKEWQASGLSKKAFCAQKQINYPTFQYWCKRLAGGDSAGFTEVDIRPNVPALEIVFPSGVRMMLNGEPSVAWLRELLR